MGRAAHPRLAGIVLAILVLAAGCGDAGDPGAGSPPAEDAATTAVATTAIVHFLDDSGRLVAERRPVRGGLDARSALEALAQGPRGAGLVPALPPGTAVRGVEVADGTATVDFGEAFESGYPSGGAAAETAVIAPIIYTLTALPGVRRVRITVEGRVPEPPGTQLDLSGPLTRADLPVTVVPAR